MPKKKLGFNIIIAHEIDNLVPYLDDHEASQIADTLYSLIETDQASRSNWKSTNEKWLELAAQTIEKKNNPWPNAANIKYPLVSLASLQFHARSYPALFGKADLVNCRVLGTHSEEKLARKDRVRKFMSAQLTDLMEGWLEDQDRLLLVLGILGLAYKKTYFDSVYRNIRSELLLPNDVIINYYAKDYSRARITHKYTEDVNQIREKELTEIYSTIREVESTPESNQSKDKIIGLSPTGNVSTGEQYDIPIKNTYECHCWLDLDDDGYYEPYIAVLDPDAKQLRRLVARWGEEDIRYTPNGDIVRIDPEEYFTPYMLFPDAQSSVYGRGFGNLLGHTNLASNTILNQLVDSGTLSNLQSGFIGKSMNIPGGELNIQPGKWKVVQTYGDDIRKAIVPLPTKEPSGTLFNLLGLLLQAGQDLGSIQDVMLGKNPGQNQPLGTTMEVLSQGMQVFNGIYKRIYRAFKKELQKIYKLNGKYLDPNIYAQLLDLPPEAAEAVRTDFIIADRDIIPAADPNMVADQQNKLKSEMLLQHAQQGLPINIQEATRRYLEAYEFQDVENIMNVPPPEPDFKTQLEMDKLEHQKQMDTANLQLESLKVQYEVAKKHAETLETMENIERGTIQDAIAETKAIASQITALAQSTIAEKKAKEIPGSAATRASQGNTTGK